MDGFRVKSCGARWMVQRLERGVDPMRPPGWFQIDDWQGKARYMASEC